MGRVLRIGAGLALALLIATCRDERVAGPLRPSALVFDLRGLLTPPAPGQPDIPIDSVRVTLQRTGEATFAFDSTFRVRGDTLGDSLKLTINVVMNTSPEDMALDVTTWGQGIQWYAVNAPVTLTAGEVLSTRFIAVYVGPGAKAASVKILPTDTFAVGGLAFPLHGVVYDSSNVPIANVPVGYVARNAALGTVNVNYLTATFTGATAIRDSTWLVAETPTHLKDSTRVHVLPPPTQLLKVSGDGQTGGVGSALLPDSVRVLDALGAPFGGDTIAWTVVSGTASLSAATTVTDSLGYAAVIATPSVAGAVGVRATATWYGGTLGGSPQTFTATALSNAPAAITKVSGDAQGDTVTRALPAPLVVRVTNSSANPLSGVKVVWVRTQGSGTLTINPDTTTTDVNGLTQATYTLGQTAGVDSVRATVVNTGLAATFGVTAVHDVPTQVIKVSGDAQADTVNRTLAQPLKVKVADAYANGVSGEKVAWKFRFGTGGLGVGLGLVDTVVTDVTGSGQTTLKLGATAGVDTIEAKSVTTSAVTLFTATALAGGIGKVILDRTNDTIAVLATLQYHDTLKDTTGNVISGTVTWTSTLPAVATVSSTGLATAVTPGQTSIIASAGGHADTALLYVRGLTTIVVSPADTVITAIGDSLLLTSQGLDNFGVPVAGLTIRYTSATPTVATVNAVTGRVHLVGAGNGVVVAKDSVSGKQGSATLRVNQVTASLKNVPLLPDSLQVGVGGLGQIIATALDRNGFPIPGKVFGYTSRTPAIATVSLTGLVTGVALGRTYVADSVDGFKDSVLVAVVPAPPKAIQWGYDSIAVGNGGNISVAVSLSSPPVGAPLIIKFVSSDTLTVKPQTPTITIPSGSSAGSIVLNGLKAGRVTVVAVDSTGLGYLSDTMVVTVVSTIEFREIGSFSQQPYFYVNRNETHQAQVFLSDPAPAGGLGVTFVYKLGDAVVTPAPAIIPAGQLSANITITGLATGTDSVVPTSGGFVGKYSTVYVAANNLHINSPYPYTGVLGVGQYFQPYTSIQYSMDHPLVVSNTLAPPIGTVEAQDTIATNSYNTNYATVVATALGTVTYTVTATGWNPDSAHFVFSTPKLAVNGSNSMVAGDPSLGYWYGYPQDSLGYGHYVANYVTVTLRSRDTNIVAVRDSVGQVAPANSQVYVPNSLQAKATAGGDSVWVVASAAGYRSDSMLIRVAKPTLTIGYNYPYDGRVGAGMLRQSAAYLQIPYVRPDTFWVHFTQSRRGVLGPGLDSVPILKGQTYAAFDIRGDTVSTIDTLAVDTVKTKGYVVGAPFVFQVDPVRVAPYSYPSTLYTISAPSQITAYARDAVNNYPYPLVAPLTVTLVSRNPAAWTLDSGKVVIPAGSYYSNGTGSTRPYDTLRVVGVDSIGSYIVATAPGAVTDSSGVIRVYPTPLNVNIAYPYSVVGRGLKLQSNYVSLSGGNAPAAIKVALTHNPALDSTSVDTVVIPQGQSISNYFEIIGKDSSGTDSVVATAPGYVRNRGTFNLYPVSLVQSNPGTSHLTTDPASYIYTYTETRNGWSFKPATPVTFTIVSTDSNVIKIDSALTGGGPFGSGTGTAKVDTSLTYAYYKIRYVGSGTAQLIVATPGFKSDTTPAITVTGPSLRMGTTSFTIGQGQVFQYEYVYVNNAVASNLVVHLAKSDSTLPAASQAFLLSADSVVIPAGQTSSPYFTVTGQNIGSANVIATATGYSQVVATVQVGQPRLLANYTNLTQYVDAVPTPVYVSTTDQNNNGHPVASPLVVGDTVSDPTIAATDSAVKTIPTLGSSLTFNVSGIKKGSVNLVFSAAAYKSDTVVVSVDTGQLVIYGAPLVLGPGQTTSNNLYVQVPFTAAAPILVSLNSSNPSVATVPATVTIPANNSYVYIPVNGVGLGTTTITATASNAKAAAPVNVVVSTPKLVASISGTSYAGQKTTMYVYAEDSVGNYRTLTTPLTVTLASSISGHTAFDSATITIPAGNYYASTGVTFDTAGSYTLTAQATGYTASSVNTTVVGAVVSITEYQFGPQTVTIPAGSYVTWKNNGTLTHTSTSDTSQWDTGNITPGTSSSVYFSTSGTYTYHCNIHSTMTGTVIVQ